MAALMTIAQAESHLRLSANYDRADVDSKMELASAIILDYLKTRAHKRATVTSSSVASPTVMTTEESHGFANGDRVTIADHEDSTPSVNGTWTLSSVTSTTFTIPVAVTVAGTGGTALVEWTEDTVPLPVQQASLLMLTHLFEHRGNDQKADEDLWLAIERLLVRSRDPAFA